MDWNASNFFLGHAFTNMLVSHFLSGEFRNLIGRQIHMTWSVLKMLVTKKVKIKSSSGVHGPKPVGLGPAKLRYLGPAWTRTGPGQNFENLGPIRTGRSVDLAVRTVGGALLLHGEDRKIHILSPAICKSRAPASVLG